MPAFAVAEARANAAVLRRLTNSSFDIGGQQHPCIFDNGYMQAPMGGFGAATSQPRLTCATASLPADLVGAAVVVAGQGFTVVEHQPDGTGISVLVLGATA